MASDTTTTTATNAASDVRAPLRGVRVLDFCAIYAGPFACSTLGVLGADVIRIESSARPEMLRYSRARKPDDAPSENGPAFHVLNHNKRGVTLNLREPRAIEIIKRLAEHSDVVVENFRPGVMQSLGLGYEDLRAVNPRIIMTSMAAMGDTGPERRYGALATTFSALAGLSHMTGYADGAPTEYRGSSDFRSGFIGIFATVAALFHRQRTGVGQRIDLSARDALASLIGDTLMDYSMNQRSPHRDGNRSQTMAPHGVYQCTPEEHWISIAVGHEDEWQRFCAAIGQPALATDPRFLDNATRLANREALDTIISEWTSTRADYEVMRTLQAAGVAAMPSMRTDEIVTDPHLKAREFLQLLHHDLVGPITLMNVPWKMSASPGVPLRPGPMLGEHNDAVLTEILGMTPEEIAALKAEQVVY